MMRYGQTQVTKNHTVESEITGKTTISEESPMRVEMILTEKPVIKDRSRGVTRTQFYAPRTKITEYSRGCRYVSLIGQLSV